MKIYSLKVKEIKRETEEAITIKFENPSEGISYKSGQFITLILNIDGQEIRRSYSLNSAPGVDPELSVSVKAVSKGLVSNHLNQNLLVGDTLQVIEPMGNFHFTPGEYNKRHLILIGAGSGITPLYSIIKSVLHKEPNSKVSLIYGNRTKESIIYGRELTDLEIKYPERFTLVNILTRPAETWVGYTGRINEATVVNIVEKLAAITHKECSYYLCGPKGMMDETLRALDLLSVPKLNIFKESFGTEAAEPVEVPVVASTPNGKSKVTILEGKKKYEFEVDPKDTILQTALDKGINLPYSCQSGMCTACMGKCTSGKVFMDNPDGLTEGEIKNGYVLTCIGHPASPEIVIEL